MERKSRMKRALLRHGFSTPAFRTIEGLQDIGSLVELPTPHVLKPDAGTESMGVVRVDELGGSMAAVELLANQYGWPILVETWSRAREFTVAVLGNKAARRAFPTEVIVPPPYSYLTAEAKRQGALATTVPIYEQDLHERVSSLAISVADRLGLRDCVRMEILLDRTGDLSVIDVNTLPGLRPGPEHQSYLLSCLAANLGFNQSETVLIIIAAAARRNGLPITSVLGDVWCRLDEGRRVHLDESSPH